MGVLHAISASIPNTGSGPIREVVAPSWTHGLLREGCLRENRRRICPSSASTDGHKQDMNQADVATCGNHQQGAVGVAVVYQASICSSSFAQAFGAFGREHPLAWSALSFKMLRGLASLEGHIPAVCTTG